MTWTTMFFNGAFDFIFIAAELQILFFAQRNFYFRKRRPAEH
jgi:hypothetical protein